MHPGVPPLENVPHGGRVFGGHELVAWHAGVVCDWCNRHIAGARYKCGNCADFDLCEGCESGSASVHCPTHVFIKLKLPASMAGRTKSNECVPLLIQNVYTELAPYVFVHPEPCIAGQGPVTAASGGDSSTPLRWVFDQLSPNLPAEVPCVEPAEIYLQTWVVMNSGNRRWAQDLVLKQVKGPIIEDPHVLVPTTIPALHPGECCQIHIQLQAPRAAGYHESQWAVSDLDEKNLICGVYVKSRPPVPYYEHNPLDVCYSPGVNSPPEHTDEQSSTDSLFGSSNERQDGAQAATGEAAAGEAAATKSDSKETSADKVGTQQAELKADNVTESFLPGSRGDSNHSTNHSWTDLNSGHGGDEDSASQSVDILTDSDMEDMWVVGSRKLAVSYRARAYGGDGSSTSCSEAEDEEDDFIMVPLPDCFNLPSTTQLLDDDTYSVSPQRLTPNVYVEDLEDFTESAVDISASHVCHSTPIPSPIPSPIHSPAKCDVVVEQAAKLADVDLSAASMAAAAAPKATADVGEKERLETLPLTLDTASEHKVETALGAPATHTSQQSLSTAEKLAAEDETSGGRDEASGGRDEASGGRDKASGGGDETSGGRKEASGGTDEALGGRDEASGGRDEASGGIDEASGGRDEASGGRDEALGGRDEASGERDEASGGKDDASDGEDETSGGRDEVSSGKDQASGQREEASVGEQLRKLKSEKEETEADTLEEVAEYAVSKIIEASQGVARNFINFFSQQDEYVPPAGDWSPPTSTWKPPTAHYVPSPSQDRWTPDSSQWTPSDDNYIPPRSEWMPPGARSKEDATSDDGVTYV